MKHRKLVCLIALIVVFAMLMSVLVCAEEIEDIEIFLDDAPVAQTEAESGGESMAEWEEVSLDSESEKTDTSQTVEPEAEVFESEEFEEIELAPVMPTLEKEDQDETVFLNAAVRAEGQCGDSLTWSLSEDGMMTISGMGRMWDFRNDADYFDYHECPWEEMKDDITRVVFTEGISYVGADAFFGCNNLTNVEFADSIKEIGHFAFSYDRKLGNFTLPTNLESIGQDAFCMTAITAIDIPGSVSWVDACICEGCEKLASVLFCFREEEGYGMGNSPFRFCTALESIEVEEGHGALHTKDGALYLADTLMQYPPGRKDASCYVEEGCSDIQQMAFEGASYLQKLWLPRSIKSISRSAFEECYALQNVTYEADEAWWNNIEILEDNEPLLSATLTYEDNLPSISGKCGDNATWTLDRDGVLTIAGTGQIWDFTDDASNYDYHTCPWSEWREKGIKKVVVGEGITYIGTDVFRACIALESVSLPETLQEIGNYSFFYCSALKSISLPSSLKRVGAQVFSYSGLTSITIPGTLVEIGSGLCEGCDQLTSARFLAALSDAPMTSYSHPFRWCPALQKIEVEAGHKTLHIYDGALYQGDTLIQYPNGRTNESCRVQPGCTTIDFLAFESTNALKSVSLPNTLSFIAYGSFRWCENLKQVEYEGTEQAWKRIFIADENEPLTNSELSFLNVPQPTEKPTPVSTAKPTTSPTTKPTASPTTKPSTSPTTQPETKISISECKITIKDQTYTGNKLKPAVTVKYGGKKLKLGTDYTVSFKNNKAIGTATATIKGKGDYTGSKKVTFKILPKAVTGLKLKAGEKQMTVTWKKGSGGITGYQLQYSLKKNFSSKKILTISKASTVKRAIKKLKTGKTYYVRIRAFKALKSGTKYYSKWSSVKKASVK